MKKLITINRPVFIAKLKAIGKTIGQMFMTLVIMVWALMVYLLDGSPDKYDIREARQSYDGDAYYDYQIANMIGWHSPVTQSQWWCLLVAGLICILGGVILYIKWTSRSVPPSTLPSPTS